jgi:hypothetical protein
MEKCRPTHTYLQVLYEKNDQVKDAGMGRTCRTHAGKRNVYRVLVGKPEGKRPLGRPRRRWEDV